MVRVVDKKHFVVACMICGNEGEWCPRRAEMLDGTWRATVVFQRTGWVQYPPPNHGLPPSLLKSDMSAGKGEWRCPPCARLAEGSRRTGSS